MDLPALKLKPEWVGTADVFVSHTWLYDFKSVLCETVSHFDKEDTRHYFRIAIFCVNQTGDENGPSAFEDNDAMFRNAIESTSQVLSVVYPWRSPGNVKRWWCLYEINTALQNPLGCRWHRRPRFSPHQSPRCRTYSRISRKRWWVNVNFKTFCLKSCMCIDRSLIQ